MKNELKELIVVKQLPVIEERLKNLSIEIDSKVENALSLVVSDETIKEVKKVRADLNNDFKELEEIRKAVKEKVITPYMAFEEIYKECVSNKFKNADSQLKEKIDEVEETQKKEKSKEIESYYIEYANSVNLEWLTNEKYFLIANINVTLSASMKSLKDQAKAFIDKVVDDLSLIETQEHKEEIIVEYRKDLNVSKAIKEVSDRYYVLECVKKEQESLQEVEKKENETIEKVNEVVNVVVEEKEEKKYKMTFTINGTMEQLKKVKAYLIEEGLYE